MQTVRRLRSAGTRTEDSIRHDDRLLHRTRSVSSPLAIGRSKEYSKNAEDEKEAITYPGTATERIARNEAWKKNADSEEAKTRIAKRLKEAGGASPKSAADPRNK